MLGLLLVASAGLTALLVAAAARLPSLVSTLLLVYLTFVANLGLVTLALSPFREVTRGGLAVAEAVLLIGALAGWWLRGRPGLPLAAARAAVREVIFDPVTGLFLLFVLLVLAYELLLTTVPPNNGDALAYHLTKAAAWVQHGGYHWIPDAPTVRMNAFQPLAEQQLLFLFVATGSGALSALPQYLAELAILVSVYGAARRLGFEVRPAACSAFLVATFSLVALESTTAQNDLVAASFPVVAACLLLGRGGGLLEPALAGAAAGFGLGAKLTTALVLPVLVWLVLVRGRRFLAPAVVGGLIGFAAIGMWGYVLNLVHSGHLLGSGTAEVLNRASPSYPGSVANAFYLTYGLMDGSVLSSRLIHFLALAGLVAAVGAGAWALHRSGRRQALADAAGVATPFLAPLFVIGAGGILALIARRWGFPIEGPGGIVEPLNEVLSREYTRMSHHSFSAFGPVGIVALLAATALTIWAYVARKADARHLALACALPLFLILTSLITAWNPFLVRFFLVPAVLAAPLLARLFRGRVPTAAYLVVAALTVGLTIIQDQTKPFKSRPWTLNQSEALVVNSSGYMAEALAAYEELVPAGTCVGAVLDPWEPSYLLFGPSLQHHVVYLPAVDALTAALRNRLAYVVVTTGTNGWVADTFKEAGWSIRPLGELWLLASDPQGGSGTC